MFKQILHVSVCVWKGGSGLDRRQVQTRVCVLAVYVCVTVSWRMEICAPIARRCACVRVWRGSSGRLGWGWN